MMKKFKRPLSLLLSFCMVFSLFGVVPATAAGENYAVSISEETVDATNGIYKLVINAKGPANLGSMFVSLKFDGNIVPVYYEDVTQTSSDNGALKSLILGSSKAAMVSVKSQDKTMFYCGITTTKGADISTAKNVMEFYYKVTDTDKMNKGSWSFVTDDNELTSLWGDNTGAAIKITTTDSPTVTSVYEPNVGSQQDGAPISLTKFEYTNSTADTLTGVTIAEQPAKTIAVPTLGNTATLNLTATAQGVDGAYDGAAITWSIPETHGVSIDNKGTLTVSPSASKGRVTVTATATAGAVTQTTTANVTITKAASAATTVEVTGASSVTVPTTTNATETYTATVKDQFGAAMTGEAVTWRIDETPLPTGVSINATGVLTVTKEALPGSITVKATSGTLSGTKNVSISPADSVLDSFVMKNGGVIAANESIRKPTTDNVTRTYTIDAKDQYGATMSPEVTWTVSPENKGVTVFDEGTVIITKEATVQDYTVTAASGEKSASVKISVINKDVVTVSGVSVTDKTYDGNAIAYSGTPTAKNGDQPVTISEYTYTWYQGETELAAPKDAGTYKLVVAVADSNVDYSGKQEITFTISKAEITEISGITAANKVYDGNTNADLTLTEASLTGKIGTENLTVASATGAFDSKDAGQNKSVTVSGVTLGGTAAVNYKLAESCTITKPIANITAKELTFTSGTVSEKVYDSTDAATITTVTFDGLVSGESLAIDTDYTISNAKFASADAGTDKNVTATVALKTEGTAKNYSLSNGSLTTTGTITKADRTINITEGDSITLAGNTLSTTLTVTSNTDLDKSFKPTYKSDDLNVATVDAVGTVKAISNGTATITVTSDATTNYSKATATVTVKVVTAPVTDVSVVSSESSDKLTAVLEGQTIKVFGFVTKDKTITVTPTYFEGVTLKAGDTTTVVANADALKTGGSFIVKCDGNEIGTYTIDTSKVVMKPNNVTIQDATNSVTVEENVSDEVLTALQDADTKIEGLEAAVASAIVAAATGFDAGETVTATVTMKLQATAASGDSLSLEIKPELKLEGKKGGSNASETTPVKMLPAPIKISIKLPTTFGYSEGQTLYAKHTKADNSFEYLPITVTGNTTDGYVATWYQSSFSPVEIKKDDRKAIITYTYENETTETITYTPADIGVTNLPTDSKSGYTFNGWTMNSKTYSGTLTDEMLTEMNGTHNAAASFTQNTNTGGGGGGDGAIATTYTITATAGEGGTITPNGKVTVTENKDQSFTMKANNGYAVYKLLVDGKEVTVSDTYTFSTVKANHTISATFKKADTTKPIFNDIQNHWAKDSIEKIVALGIMNGVGNEQFAPDLNTSRAMLVTVLYRLEKEPNMTISSFMDVPSDAYYAKAVAWAEQNGIVDGIGGNQFAPNQDITREQLAAILYRYAKYKGMDVSGRADLDGFADRTNVGAWALDAMRWAVSSKLIGGRSATELAPDGKATRAEVATILVRWLEA